MTTTSKTNPLFNSNVLTVIFDTQGQEILAIGATECTILGPDGTVSKCRNNTNIQLVDGTVYNPAMSMGANPVLLLGVCEACRFPEPSLFKPERPTHGLCNRRAGRSCASCSAFLCPRHAHLCDDQQYRCKRCAKKRSIKMRLMSIFFDCEG